ncbi:RHS repeat-associated core domain-containing protein [Treponema denticola OTK]|uniref:RHS repeat-associated core domain-containing protein n=2 Tax=Treponema denticola TaxID=158 RepID=A0A0F6MSD2_TREDN|nr:RHS repeat-associated core domain-containing protein [Treponema denticola OTK]
MKYLCRLMEIFVLSYFINENRNNFYMKTKLYIYSQSNYLSRTAIEAKILFAVCLSKKQALTGGKSLASKDKCSKKIGAESAVLHFVFFMIIINKMQQSAKIKLLINLPTDRTFGNRWSRYKEPSKNKAEAYQVYVEHLFLRSDAGDARIFSKEEDVYGIDYGFGLDAPKETEQTNPQDLFAYRRNYTWNERNLLTKSSDRNFTVHYRYGDDGQRALKYTDEGRSETLYFNNFFTIHIPTQDQNNPQGLRVHKHIFVGNSRLVTAMTHTDNSGDNEEQKAKRYYYHADHLQSAQFVTDWKGRQYEHIEYTPYGELWIEEVATGLDKLPFRFTGKEMDEETGLYYYGARYLDPKYSRWLSGDPALGEYIPQAPINDEAKKHNENLPDMGGVFNTVNLHVYHYAGNNPVKYTDPDGRLLINNVSENSASAREYERNHNLRYIAFLIKTLDAKGNAQIPIGNIDIILEKGLNKSLTLANAVKNNPNYVVDVKAIASETKNGNYQIDIDVLVFHYGADGKLVCDVNNSGTIAFADSSELGVFGPNSSIDQKLVNQKANEVINTVLHISNANLVGDK